MNIDCYTVENLTRSTIPIFATFMQLQDRVNRSNEDNEAHSKHFNLLVSSLGFPPGNTEEIVGAAIDTFLRLKQEIIDLKATEVDSKTRLQTTQTELSKTSIFCPL